MNTHNSTSAVARPRTGRLAALAGLALCAAVVLLPASAAARDRNHDRIPDRWEKRHGLSLKVKQGHRDQDRDGLRNRGEFKAHMDPLDADSDSDGVEDGNEGAGTVESFDESTGRLSINVFGGDTVSGLVTDATEIECDDGDDHGDEDDDNSGPSENSGPGSLDDDDEDGEDADEGDDDSSGPSDSSDDEDEDDAADETDDGDDGDEADEDELDDERACSTSNLTPGAVVQEAELEIDGGGAVWDEVELLVR